MENTNPENQRPLPFWKRFFTVDFWHEQNHWLFFLTFLLVFTVIIYTTTHSLESNQPSQKEYWDDPHEAEYKRLDNNDITYITSLINQGSTFIRPDVIAANDSSQIIEGTQAGYVNIHFKDNPNCRTVKNFILDQLPYVYPVDTAKFFALLDEQPNTLAVSFIETAKFRVKSYFWLAGPHTYFEVIFWTIFGVISSILFYIGIAISTGKGFKPSETPGHLAKIVYSPFISLIIIFSYNYLSSPDSVVDISASKGTLIISFLLGFYSSRAMKMLDKLKDLILPYGDEPKSVATPTEKTDPEIVPLAGQAANVTVSVIISDPQNENAAQLNAQLGQAAVSLTPQNGGNPISLQCTTVNELEGTFTANNITTGNYTLSASVITKDGSNYSAGQPVQVNNDGNMFSLTLTKTNSTV